MNNMDHSLLRDKSVLRFLAVTFLLGMGLQIIFALGLTGASKNWEILLLFAMWTPAIGAFAAGRDVRIGIFANLKRIPPLWLLAAVPLASLPFILSQSVNWILNLGTWNDAKLDLLLRGESQSVLYLSLNIILTGMWGGLMTAIFLGIGEEIGWRGFLQQKLCDKFGFTYGILLLGLIWAFWHTPVNLVGLNGKEHFLLITFVTFPLSVVFISYTLAWLRIKSDAIWPCAMFHGVSNTVEGISLVKPNTEMIRILTDLCGYAAVGLMCWWLSSRRHGGSQSNCFRE